MRIQKNNIYVCIQSKFETKQNEKQQVTFSLILRCMPRLQHYLLFNKEGVMVDFGSHLRPSTPQTKTAIEELLEQ